MRAIVVGGGIGGPAAALALRQVGVEPLLLEARTHPERGRGSYVTIAPNGLDALDALGLLPMARSIGMPTRHNVMVDTRGRVLGRVALGHPLADGTPAQTMKRSELAYRLAEELRARGVEQRQGARVAQVEDHGAHVTVRLDTGEELVADMVVGADGVRSVVRRMVDPYAPEARYVGLTNFGGVTPCAAEGAGLAPEAWHFVFGRRAFFGAHPTPAGDVVWFVNVPRERIEAEERRETTDQQWRHWLVDLLSADQGPAAGLVRDGVLELAGDSTHDLRRLPRWHRGRVAVIGDAAHAPAPSSGQGASMALEDAVLLAVAVRERCGDGDPGPAFHAFEELRRPRVERIVAAGARSSSAKIPQGAGRVLRDAVLRLVFRYAVTDRSTAWMYDHRIDMAAPLPVPAGSTR